MPQRPVRRRPGAADDAHCRGNRAAYGGSHAGARATVGADASARADPGARSATCTRPPAAAPTSPGAAACRGAGAAAADGGSRQAGRANLGACQADHPAGAGQTDRAAEALSQLVPLALAQAGLADQGAGRTLPRSGAGVPRRCSRL